MADIPARRDRKRTGLLSVRPAKSGTGLLRVSPNWLAEIGYRPRSFGESDVVKQLAITRPLICPLALEEARGN